MFKNVGSNWVVTLVTVAALYVLTPFTIHRLGEDAYGTWMLITAMTGYLSLLVLGVPMAAVRSFAQHVAVGDEQKLSEAIGGCMALYLLLGGIALVVGGLVEVRGMLPRGDHHSRSPLIDASTISIT